MLAPSPYRRRATKQDVCEQFISKLAERGDIDVNTHGFSEAIHKHFEKLPTRYALDVNIDSLDVLSHKRLLDEARADPATVSFAVRSVEVLMLRQQDGQPSPPSRETSPRRLHFHPRSARPLPRPAFGSSPNLQALALEAGERLDSGGLDHMPGERGGESEPLMFYEITIASVDQPKLLSRLSQAMGDLSLNIREAHAFNTSDGFALDVFVVDGWSSDGGESLEEQLGQRLLRMPAIGAEGPSSAGAAGPGPGSAATAGSAGAGRSFGGSADSAVLRLPEEAPMRPYDAATLLGGGPRQGSPPVDDWEIDIMQLQIDSKVAAGAFSNLYRGYYCGQEVAVKILKDIQDDTTQHQEFLQEVSIMRKVRHKNVVQFIGACTRKPNLCIVFEYMSGGSVYDYMRREGQLKILSVMKIAVEVARGMDYLHQRKIIHRDLKAANLLLDENNIVKIADFGVARIIEGTGHMTAETGTYRWMAPEVIEHKPYDEKADVFSFGVVLWELLTCKVPYSDMTPLQAAVGVVQKGLRPGIPPGCPRGLATVMNSCWDGSPSHRPTFRDLVPQLQLLLDQMREDEARRLNKGGLLSKLRGKAS